MLAYMLQIYDREMLINSLGGRLKQLFMVSITSFLSQTFFPSMLVNCKGMGKAVFRPLFL